MSAYSYDVLVYGSTEPSIFFAIRCAQQGYSVGLISENGRIGGLTAGSLGYQDMTGNAMLATVETRGEYGRYLRNSAFPMGNRTTRVVVPSMVERLFKDMLGLFGGGVTVHRNQRIASASLGVGNKVASVTMISGDVFNATLFYDGSMCQDLVQAAGAEGVTWQIGTESADAYSESKGGFQAASVGTGNAYSGPGGTLDALAISDPELATGAPWAAVQAYAYRVIYSVAAPGDHVPFNIAKITPLGGGTAIFVTDPTIYDPDKFVFYGATRASERAIAIDRLSGGGRGWLPNALIQDNDDTPLRGGDGNPRHWTYARFNKADPAATYAYRASLEYDVKLFTMQSRAWMMTDPRYSGVWQDSCGGFGWPQREFRSTNNIPWQFYIREGVRPIGDYVLSQDDLSVTDTMAAKNILKADSIALAGYAFDTHICAYSPVGSSTTQYRQLGKTASGGPEVSSSRGYAIPWRACFNSARANLIHLPSASHLAWSSVRIIQNLILAAEGCACAVPQLMAGTAPAAVDSSILHAAMTADADHPLPYVPLG